jgi:DNA-binding IclR family transcriptional regulator
MPRKSAVLSLADQDAAPGGVAAVDRALSLLQAFRSGDEPLSLATLSERTLMHKSTALRLLASLEHAMLVERQSDGRYILGRGVQRLYQVQQANFDLEAVVMPALRELVAQTGESATLHALWGKDAQGRPTHRVSLYRVDSPQPVRDHFNAGDLLPLESGSGAIVLLAFGANFIPAGARFGPQELEQARQQGYSAGVGLRVPEMAGVAAPVFHWRGGKKQLLGALISTMPANRYTDAHIARVTHIAADLSAKLCGPA